MEVMPGLPEYSYSFTQITHEAESTNAKRQSIIYNIIYNKCTVVLRAESALFYFNEFFSKEQRRHHDRKRN